VFDDLRICFVGDSFVAGTGDPEHLGWVGRVAARTHRAGQALSAFNLGVRRETSRDVRARWRTECRPRLPTGCAGRVLFSFGVNDTSVEHGQQRVDVGDSGRHLAAVLAEAKAAGWPALVVGPPPVGDIDHNARIANLDTVLRRVSCEAGVAYITTLTPLQESHVWMHQVAAGDAAHPGAEGYALLADLVWPYWANWLEVTPPQRASSPPSH
jgi:acyl-CoA thioesterase-1